jgi:exonuclease SbcC
MIPVTLKISGFLSYLNPVELDFTSFELACISGANGAGKSSLLDAITWALFGEARRKDEAIINSHAKSAEICFDFLYENNLYRIQRTKPRDKTSLLEFFIQTPEKTWRPLTEHSVRETENRIKQTLRLDYDTFTNASFFLQGKADQFAQQRPGDRKRILSTILGLEIWETYRTQAAEMRKQIETEQTSVTGMLEEINNELGQEAERKARLSQLEDNLDRLKDLRQSKQATLDSLRLLAASLSEQRRLVETLGKQYQTARQRRDQRAAQLDERRAERQRYQQQIASAAQLEKAYQEWLATRQALEAMEQVAANFRQHDAQRTAPRLVIESERSALDQQLQTFSSQQRQIETLAGQLPALQDQFAKAQAALQDLDKAVSEKTSLEADLSRSTEISANNRAENKRLKAEMEDLRERISHLKEMKGAECPWCGQPLPPEERETLINTLEAQGKERGDRYRANLADTQEAEKRVTELDSRLTKLRQLEIEWRTAQRQVDQLHDRLVQMTETVSQWQQTGQPQLAELERKLSQGDYAQAARQELAALDDQLKALGYDAAAHDYLRQRELAGRSSEAELRGIDAAKAALGPLDRELANLQAQLEADQVEISGLESSYRQAEEKYQKDADRLPDLNQVEDEVLRLQSDENQARMQVGGARQSVEVLKTMRERQAENKNRWNELAKKINQLKILERSFGKDGVPALLIEQALPEIEAQANQILDRLATGGMSVRFATQKDYKDKSREDKKETLEIWISDSAGTREYEMFSGGEAFRVNFAIRLALSRVLAKRAGARLQTLVIDEGFGSQDAEGRQRLIEAINLIRPDFAKILVITHLEELKEAFPTRIEVEKTLSGSSVLIRN